MTAGQVVNTVNEVKTTADGILEVLKQADPELAVPAEVAGKAVDLAGGLVTSALAAYSAASGTPINAETIATLMPAPIVLDQPTE